MSQPLRRKVKRWVLYIRDRALSYYGRARMHLVGGFRCAHHRAPFHRAEQGNLFIFEKLASGTPTMVARYGLFELQAVASVLFPRKAIPAERVLGPLCYNAGFFPRSLELLHQFAEEYRDASTRIDVFCAWLFRHGMWREEELAFSQWCPEPFLTDIRALDAFLWSPPWTAALEGRKVLVVHPFARTIVEQYQRREKLFKDHRVLPRFSKLDVLPAVQSIAGNPVPFANWFDALEYMKNEIRSRDFDVALIGAGAYGLPLAGFVKSLGRQAVHVGGVLQLFFGIRGARWEKWYPWLFNEWWVRPALDERPANAHKIEGACYW